MSDYSAMSAHYDLIMTTGYYDYDAIVEPLARLEGARSVLELGAGTGLILEKLAARRPQLRLAGVDLTRAMLDLAADRLAHLPEVSLYLQDVTALALDGSFDAAFSYGGVWYFVPAGYRRSGYDLVSHLRQHAANERGLERVAAHLPAGGTLLLGIQGPHADYTRPVTGELDYAQQITPIEHGFRKRYALTDRADEGRTVMQQTTDYRVYGFDDAVDLLDKAGFDHRPGAGGGVFLVFTRR